MIASLPKIVKLLSQSALYFKSSATSAGHSISVSWLLITSAVLHVVGTTSLMFLTPHMHSSTQTNKPSLCMWTHTVIQVSRLAHRLHFRQWFPILIPKKYISHIRHDERQMLNLSISTTFDPHFFIRIDYLVMASSCSSHGLEQFLWELQKHYTKKALQLKLKSINGEFNFSKIGTFCRNKISTILNTNVVQCIIKLINLQIDYKNNYISCNSILHYSIIFCLHHNENKWRTIKTIFSKYIYSMGVLTFLLLIHVRVFLEIPLISTVTEFYVCIITLQVMIA